MYPLLGLIEIWGLCQVCIDFQLFAACTLKLLSGKHSQNLHRSLTTVFHTFDVITFVIAFLSSGNAASACQSADTAQARPTLYAHRESLVPPNNQQRMERA